MPEQEHNGWATSAAPRWRRGLTSCIAAWCLLLLTGACALPLKNELPTTAGTSVSDGSATLVSLKSGDAPSRFVAPEPTLLPAASADVKPVPPAAKSGDAPSRLVAPEPTVLSAAAEVKPMPPAATPRSQTGPPDFVVPASAQQPLAPALPGGPVMGAAPISVEQEMTVEQALRYAVQNHPRLRARRHEIDVAKAKLITAGLAPNPQLVLDSNSPVSEADGSRFTARLEFTIPTGGKLGLAKSAAQAGISRAQCALGRETELVLQQAGDAAVEVLYLQELLDLQGRLSKMAAAHAEVQQGRFEAKQIPAADKILAQADAVALELRRLEAAARLDTARMRLSQAIGLNAPGVVRLHGRLTVQPLPAIPLEQIVAVAERNAPRLGEACAALLQSQRQLGLDRAKALPDFVLGPRGQTTLGGTDTGPSRLGMRAAMDLPVFNRNQGGICQSAAQTQVDRALLDDTALTVSNDAASVYDELRSLQARLRYYEKDVLPLADRTEATLREDAVALAIRPVEISRLLEEFVVMRVTYLQLRYRHEQLYRQLEIMLGCPLAMLEAGRGPAGVTTAPESIPAPPSQPWPVRQ